MTVTEQSNLHAKHDSECGEYDRYFEINEGCRILDLGGHIGYFSMYACDKGAFCLAFEPHPDNFKLLNENLKGLNAIAINKAASNHSGTATLHEHPGNNGGHSLYKHEACSDVEYEVGCVNIGGFCQQIGFTPDFIKIDTEGSEADIMASLLGNNIKAPMAVECHTHDLQRRCKHIAEANDMRWIKTDIPIGVNHFLP